MPKVINIISDIIDQFLIQWILKVDFKLEDIN